MYEGIAKAIGQSVKVSVSKDGENTDEAETEAFTTRPLVSAEHINIYVSHDIYATKVDSNPVNPDDETPINEGMHAKLTLVIQFNEKFYEDMALLFKNKENINGVPLTLKKLIDGENNDEEKNNEEKVNSVEEEEDEAEDEDVKKSDGLKIEDCFEVRLLDP